MGLEDELSKQRERQQLRDHARRVIEAYDLTEEQTYRESEESMQRLKKRYDPKSVAGKFVARVARTSKERVAANKQNDRNALIRDFEQILGEAFEPPPAPGSKPPDAPPRFDPRAPRKPR